MHFHILLALTARSTRRNRSTGLCSNVGGLSKPCLRNHAFFPSFHPRTPSSPLLFVFAIRTSALVQPLPGSPPVPSRASDPGRPRCSFAQRAPHVVSFAFTSASLFKRTTCCWAERRPAPTGHDWLDFVDKQKKKSADDRQTDICIHSGQTDIIGAVELWEAYALSFP